MPQAAARHRHRVSGADAPATPTRAAQASRCSRGIYGVLPLLGAAPCPAKAAWCCRAWHAEQHATTWPAPTGTGCACAWGARTSAPECRRRVAAATSDAPQHQRLSWPCPGIAGPWPPGPTAATDHQHALRAPPTIPCVPPLHHSRRHSRRHSSTGPFPSSPSSLMWPRLAPSWRLSKNTETVPLLDEKLSSTSLKVGSDKVRQHRRGSPQAARTDR